MTSIQKQLEQFQKTDKFKRLVAEKMKTDPTFGGIDKVAVQFGAQMRDILRDEISTIISSTTDEAFLDHIIVEEVFVPDVGWTINVSFDEDEVHRDSLFPEKYPKGVLLNEIFNEGYSAEDYVYGTDKHGSKMRSRLSYPDEDNREALYFIQRAVDAFNTQYKGKAVAKYNSKYTGGTL